VSETKVDVAGLRALLEQATPGHWIHGGQYIVAAATENHPRGRCIANFPRGGGVYVDSPNAEQAKRDADYVARAHNAMPALIAAAEERDRLRSYLDAALSKVTELEDFACTAHHGNHLQVRDNIGRLELDLRMLRDALRDCLRPAALNGGTARA
jgi:hypothetical protein